ncbi:methyltransferase domain-containing protein [Saccharomonospora azurea]|uniref:methyltransferase domain-containing protein n=1 Tax=Saccharomonospora azurea TaxID=40988 RepID=UPI003325A35C
MTRNIVDVEWRSHAHRLAGELEQAGKLTDPRLAAAVQATPRHRFTPTVYRRQPNGRWACQVSVDDLDTVYSNTTLITTLTDTEETVLSSSTQPGLMTRMIEALRLTDGARVLEIGTGTGYNAALLCHLLGEQAVFTVDVEPALVHDARQRLAQLGHHPLVVAADGAAGLAEHAPFDAILATCAVPAVPWAWVEQTTPGGVILTDLKVAVNAGSLVRLTRTDVDRAEGRFDPTYAAFMDLRHSPGATRRSRRIHRDHDDAEHRTTCVDPTTPSTSLLVWFLAALELGRDIAHGYTLPPDAGPGYDGPPSAAFLTTPDGSWAEVTLAAEPNGEHVVVEGGPRRVWRVVEHAHHTWARLGRPGWNRFGLTVTPDTHTLWLDRPDSPHTWQIPVSPYPSE